MMSCHQHRRRHMPRPLRQLLRPRRRRSWQVSLSLAPEGGSRTRNSSCRGKIRRHRRPPAQTPRASRSMQMRHRPASRPALERQGAEAEPEVGIRVHVAREARAAGCRRRPHPECRRALRRRAPLSGSRRARRESGKRRTQVTTSGAGPSRGIPEKARPRGKGRSAREHRAGWAISPKTQGRRLLQSRPAMGSEGARRQTAASCRRASGCSRS